MPHSSNQVQLGVLRSNTASDAQTTEFTTIEREQFRFRNDCSSYTISSSTMRMNRIILSKYCNMKLTYTIGEE